jgi:hypothetical protein
MPRKKQPDNFYNGSAILANKTLLKPVILTLPPAHPTQYELISALDRIPGLRFVVGAAGTKFGKALTLDTPIPTPSGWTTMGELQEGDVVFDHEGLPTTVEYATDPMHDHVCCRVTFSDGSFIDADEEHMWEVSTRKRRDQYSTISTATIQESVDKDWSVDVCGPLQYPVKELPIPPYVLGVWLGDGTGCTGVVTTDDQQVLDELATEGFQSYLPPSQKREYRIVGLTDTLRSSGFISNKHVPVQYLQASPAQRLSLLQGLMDTDGTVSRTGHCCFDNTNKVLVDGVEELLNSFGVKTSRAERVPKCNGVDGKLCYRVFFTTSIPVFRLARKLARLRVKGTERQSRRTIVSVEQIDSVPVRCIRVSNPRHLFLAGRACIPTHNTYGCTIALVQHAWNVKGSLNWWVAPTFAQSKMAYALVKRLLPMGTFVDYKADLRLELLQPDGVVRSHIDFKSGDNPDSLRGFGVHFFVMDEAARQPYESFVSLLTTTTQTQGKGLIISTPKGRGWFYDIYQRGEKKYEDGSPKYSVDDPDPWPEWLSVRMPTWVNPHVPLESVEEMRRNLPEDVFRQEVGAQFLLDSAGVFRGVRECIKGTLQDPILGHRYVMGVDLARLEDFSVICVVDTVNNHLVYFDRFNQISWDVQKHKIIDVARRYSALAVIDSTGLGDPIVEDIQRAGVKVEPYKLGGTTAKQQLIDKLRVNIENQKISFPDVTVLRRELENYEYTVSGGGVVKFSAPGDQHDDCVIALALANWASDRDPFVYKYSSIRGI